VSGAFLVKLAGKSPCPELKLISQMSKPDKSIDKAAVKALVAVYGAVEASKLSGVPFGTIKSWCFRYGWRKLRLPERPKGHLPISNKDPAEAFEAALAEHRDSSTLHLAQYTARAAKKAAQHEEPLEIARSVRDVAQVYKAVWPPEEGGEMVEGAILVGTAQVKDDTAEMLAATEILEVRDQMSEVREDVREDISDQGPQSD
jgi:hypothetical protein